MSNQQASRMNIGFVAFCAAVTGIGGFLFGYDTAVINGANTFLQQYFHLDPAKDSFLIGLATAAAIIGCIPGAMSAGFISDKFGRRKVLFFCAALYAISGVLSAIPQNFIQFVIARILSGVAIGVSSMICPVYVAEIAPPKWRGRLGTMFQLGIVVGIFVTLFINGRIQALGDEAWNIRVGWRWMLAIEALPAFVFIALLFPIPESPKWLIQAGREEEARKTLERIGGPDYTNAEVAAVREVLSQEEGSFKELFSRDYRLPLTIAMFIMLASQFSGINVVMYYSTSIFKNAAGIGPIATEVNQFRGGLKDAQVVLKLDEAHTNITVALQALRSKELQPALDSNEVAAIAAQLDQAQSAGNLDDLRRAVKAASALADAGTVKEKFREIENQANAKAFTCSVWIGFVNVIATFIAIIFVDKAGRKPLLLFGNAIQVIGLVMVGYIYSANPHSKMLLGGVITYTAAFAMAMGPIPWILCSEIFPAKLRGRAMSVSTFSIWVACYLVSQTFPLMLKAFGSTKTFWFYAACSAVTFLFVLLLVPETKGRSLEEIEKSWHKHAK